MMMKSLVLTVLIALTSFSTANATPGHHLAFAKTTKYEVCSKSKVVKRDAQGRPRTQDVTQCVVYTFTPDNLYTTPHGRGTYRVTAAGVRLTPVVNGKAGTPFEIDLSKAKRVR